MPFTLPNDEGAFRALVRVYKKAARLRNLTFTLTDNELRMLFKKNCHYCQVEPKRTFRIVKSTTPFICNGIDRIDNTKGYYTENCVPCCISCNTAKYTTPIEKMIQPGQIYGKYLAIRRSTKKDNHGNVLWETFHVETEETRFVRPGHLRKEKEIAEWKESRWK